MIVTIETNEDDLISQFTDDSLINEIRHRLNIYSKNKLNKGDYDYMLNELKKIFIKQTN